MTKKTIFAVIALVCATVALPISSCSSDEEPDGEVLADNPLALAMLQAMEQSAASGEESFVVSSSSDGFLVLGRSDYMLAQLIGKAGETTGEGTFLFDTKDGTAYTIQGVQVAEPVGKWTYAGRTSNGVIDAVKLARQIGKKIPSNKEFLLRIVPVLNEKKEVIAYDVYYQIV